MYAIGGHVHVVVGKTTCCCGETSASYVCQLLGSKYVPLMCAHVYVHTYTCALAQNQQ